MRSDAHPRVEVRCLECERPFLTTQPRLDTGRGKYCCHACSRVGTAKAQIGRPNPAAARNIREYNRRRREGDVYQRPWNKGELVKLVCEVCGREVERWPSTTLRRGRKHVYCSRACTAEAKRRVTGVNHPLYTLVERTCEWCGCVFTAKPAKVANGEARFCSRQCVDYGLDDVEDEERPF